MTTHHYFLWDHTKYDTIGYKVNDYKAINMSVCQLLSAEIF